jgi:hypothetical protein
MARPQHTCRRSSYCWCQSEHLLCCTENYRFNNNRANMLKVACSLSWSCLSIELHCNTLLLTVCCAALCYAVLVCRPAT